MKTGYLPLNHHHRLVDDIVPSMRWDGEGDFGEWQKQAKEKVYELLGIAEIEKYRTEPEIEIEYDVIAEDFGCREIRFRYKSEENVTIPCHMVIPNGADKPLPVAITLQGHSTGMHISLARPKFPGDEQTCKGGDRDFVVRAVKEGVIGIALEQRSFGENGGNTETGNTQCRETALRAMLLGRTLVGERVWDVMRLIDVLELFFSDIVDVNKIICLGNSGGGTATTYASVLEERIKISVPSCAVCSFGDSIGVTYHCNCNFVPKIAQYFDMGDLCAMIAPRNLIVVNGRHDTGFFISGSINCIDVARDAYQELDVESKLVHVIGNGEHRFYADPTWPHIHKALETL